MALTVRAAFATPRPTTANPRQINPVARWKYRCQPLIMTGMNPNTCLKCMAFGSVIVLGQITVPAT